MKRGLIQLATATLLVGCSSVPDTPSSVRGIVYTHIRIPLTVDLDHTRVAGSTGNGRIIRVKEPFTSYGITAEYSSNAIGDIAREHHMTRVDFADMEIFDILGIWRERRLILYGE